MTARTARTSSAGSVSLTRKPLAPALIASKTYSSRSNVVRMTTRVPARRSSAAIRRVASSPSMPGMRTSIRTTSGRAWIAWRTASSPSVASPTTVTSGWASSRARNPALTRAWSSASTHRDHEVTRSPTGRRARTRKPPPGAGPASTSPPSAVARSRIPVMPLPAVTAPPDAVVDDLDRDVVAVAQAHGDDAGGGVARHVGERLLHDAVGGQLRLLPAAARRAARRRGVRRARWRGRRRRGDRGQPASAPAFAGRPRRAAGCPARRAARAAPRGTPP